MRLLFDPLVLLLVALLRFVNTRGKDRDSLFTFAHESVHFAPCVEHAIVIKPVHPIVLEQVDIRKKEVSDVQKFDEEVRSEDLKIEENVPPRRKSA
jgi:hypothetical protein